MATVTISFDRIGRHHNAPDLVVDIEPVSPLGVAEAVFNHSRKFLMSREYDVGVDLEAGIGDIDGGRFGTFTISAQAD